MSGGFQKDNSAVYASAACFMHEVDPAYMGLEADAKTVATWRKETRRSLIDRRTLLSASERERRTSLIQHHLNQLLPDIGGKSISVYWPFLGEPDLRGWMTSATASGAICLLPVVKEKECPLAFRSWRLGEELTRGALNIPVPLHGEERQPDIVIAPLVGFDNKCFRLGFGGGYFDRTLASLGSRPFVIGVGFEFQKIHTIYPQGHDIPMDAIATDETIHLPAGTTPHLIE